MTALPDSEGLLPVAAADSISFSALAAHNARIVLSRLWPTTRFFVRVEPLLRRNHTDSLRVKWKRLDESAPSRDDVERGLSCFMFSEEHRGFRERFGGVTSLNTQIMPVTEDEVAQWRQRQLKASLPRGGTSPRDRRF